MSFYIRRRDQRHWVVKQREYYTITIWPKFAYSRWHNLMDRRLLVAYIRMNYRHGALHIFFSELCKWKCTQPDIIDWTFLSGNHWSTDCSRKDKEGIECASMGVARVKRDQNVVRGIIQNFFLLEHLWFSVCISLPNIFGCAIGNHENTASTAIWYDLRADGTEANSAGKIRPVIDRLDVIAFTECVGTNGQVLFTWRHISRGSYELEYVWKIRKNKWYDKLSLVKLAKTITTLLFGRCRLKIMCLSGKQSCGEYSRLETRYKTGVLEL